MKTACQVKWRLWWTKGPVFSQKTEPKVRNVEIKDQGFSLSTATRNNLTMKTINQTYFDLESLLYIRGSRMKRHRNGAEQNINTEKNKKKIVSVKLNPPHDLGSLENLVHQ